MSACESCRDPGACCAGFNLHDGPNYSQSSWWWINESDGSLAPLVKMAAMWLPFVPETRSATYYDDSGAKYFVDKWSCPLLGEDGRCTDYANRPALCDRYEAKSDPLCVEFVP